MIRIDQAPFTGPMDLLLDLVEKDKIDIYDIQIASITEKFLAAMQEVPISSEELSDFIRMASQLVLMKARMLARDQQDEDEEGLTREELIERLRLYRQYKAVFPFFQKREACTFGEFSKLPEDLTPYRKEVPDEIIGDVVLLLQQMQIVLARANSEEAAARRIDGLLSGDPYPQEVMQARIRRRLQSGIRFTLRDLLDETPSKTQVISLFLSLLELTRTREVLLEQKGKTIRITPGQGGGDVETESPESRY